jgi:hypothetical protein
MKTFKFTVTHCPRGNGVTRVNTTFGTFPTLKHATVHLGTLLAKFNNVTGFSVTEQE